MKFPKPAQQVWYEHEDVLLKYLGYLSADAPGPTAWWIGGGTLLAARWEHRQSSDIDILISTKLEEHLASEALTDIGTELRHRGLEVDLDTPKGWMHARYDDPDIPNQHRGIDLWVKEPRLRRENEIEQIETWTLPTLPTSQILYGKLLRDSLKLTRDAYDIAQAQTNDRPALESAVNSLRSSRQRRSEILWTSGAEIMDREENAILTPDGTPASNQQGCGLRAAKAVRNARWTELEITTRNGRLHARAQNASGNVRELLGPDGSPGKGCLKRLSAAGIYLHIVENYEDAGWRARDVVNEIVNAISKREDKRILHTRTAEAARLHGTPEAEMTGEIGELEQEADTEPPPTVVRGQELPVGGNQPRARSITRRERIR